VLAGGFRSRWQEVQTGFVDEPRHAVAQADGLVAEMMQRLAKVFADARGKLEEQWSRGDDISTEDLRVALRRYRSFFDRLLSVWQLEASARPRGNLLEGTSRHLGVPSLFPGRWPAREHQTSQSIRPT
jgi:hypothetical protein